MFRGHRRHERVGSPRGTVVGAASAWVSVRRRHRWGPSAPPVRVRPRPVAEPVSTAERDYFNRPAFYVRIGVLGAIALTLFGILLLRLWSLQVIQGRQFAHVTQEQSYRTVHYPTARGPIVDSSNRLLVGTEGNPAITADATTLGTLGPHNSWNPSPAGRWRLRHLARVAGLWPSTLIANIRRSVRLSPFAPAVVIARPSRTLTLYVDERAAEFRGFNVVPYPRRWYPRGAIGSEFLGLLGQVDQHELNRRRYAGARPGQVVGQSGVEASYDHVLDRGLATARVPVDARGNVVGALRAVPMRVPVRGLQLTIDSKLQRAAEKAIQDGIAFAHTAGHPDAHAGAAVVMNPRDGSIYALASYPTFDESRAATNPGYLGSLFHEPATPLINRATQGLYPTGSTFKPIVAEAALSGGLISPYTSIPCTGSLQVGNIVFHNVEPGVNADLNLDQALTVSCDTWFYRLGTMFYARQVATGYLGMQQWARLLGLGHPTGLDLPGEYGGVVPTPAWLMKTFSEPAQRIWYEGYSVNLSIGQGYLAVTPLQLAVAYSTLANGGTVVRPHVARAVLSADGTVISRLPFRPRRHVRLTDVQTIRQALYDAAHSADGTSSAIFGNFPVPVAGKTGTAQVPNGSDDSWYASWAPAGNPRVVVVVLIEHGGFGVESAAPAARELYSAFFHVH